MSATTSKVNNIVADMRKVVDPDWKIVGQAPDGQPVYEESVLCWKNVPALGEDGKPKYQLHAMHGQPMYPRRKLETWREPRQFVLYDAGNGNVRKETYHTPTAEEIRERNMAHRKHDVLTQLVHGLAQRDIDVETLLNLVDNSTDAESVEYPRNYAPGRWELSDGTKLQGNKEAAVTAEAALSAVAA